MEEKKKDIEAIIITEPPMDGKFVIAEMKERECGIVIIEPEQASMEELCEKIIKDAAYRLDTFKESNPMSGKAARRERRKLERKNKK